MSDKKPQDFDHNEFLAVVDKARDDAIQEYIQAYHDNLNGFARQEMQRAQVQIIQDRFQVLFAMDDLHAEMNYIATVVAAGIRQNSNELIIDMLSQHSGILAQRFLRLKEIAAQSNLAYVANDFDPLVNELVGAVRLAVENKDCTGVKVFCETQVTGLLDRFFAIKRESVAPRGRPSVYARIRPLWLQKEADHPNLTPQEVQAALVSDLATYSNGRYKAKNDDDEPLVRSLTTNFARFNTAKYRTRVIEAE